MKIELRITREDGRYLKYGEATAAGVPDSEIVLQTLLQHVGATATKVRTDMARGVHPTWLTPEPTVEQQLLDALTPPAPGAEQTADPEGFDHAQNRKVEVGGGLVDDQRSQYLDDEPVTLDDDARLDALRAGTPLEYEEQDFSDPTPGPVPSPLRDNEAETGADLPATPESGETVADRAARAPRTRPGRGRAVKDSPQA